MTGSYFGHTAPIIGLAFDTDNKTLISLDSTASVFRWDAATGRLVTEPVSGKQQVMPWGYSFNTISRRIAVGLLVGGGVHLRDSRTLRTLPLDPRINGHPIYCVAFNTQGTLWAAGANDGVVTLWSADGGFLGEVQRHKGPVLRLILSADDKLLASVGGDGSVILSELHAGLTATGRMLQPRLSGPIYSLAFDPNSQQLAAGANDGTVRVWDLKHPAAAGKRLASNHGAAVTLDFNKDGLRVLVGYADGTVTVWPTGSTPTTVRSFQAHSARVTALVLSPDRKWLATCGADGAIVLWSAETLKPTITSMKTHDGPATALAFSPDSTLLASGGTDGTVVLWDMRRVELGREILHESSGAIAFNPTTDALAAAGAKSGILIYLTAGASRTIATKDAVTSLAFDARGRLLTATEDGDVGIWRLSPGSDEVQTPHLPALLQQLYSIASDQSGKYWGVAGKAMKDNQTAGGMAVSNQSDEPRIVSFGDHDYGVPRIAFSADSRHVLSGGMDGKVILWSRNDNRWEHDEIARYKSYVHDVVFSRDGKRAAWAEDSGTVALYDVAEHQIDELSRTDFDRAYAVAFSPDGRFLVAGGRLAEATETEGALLVWDVPAHKKIGRQKLLATDGPRSLVFSVDGKRLFSAVPQGPVLVWDFDITASLESACRAVRPNLTKDEWRRLLPTRIYPATCM